jgi:hypothetical protein
MAAAGGGAAGPDMRDTPEKVVEAHKVVLYVGAPAGGAGIFLQSGA